MYNLSFREVAQLNKIKLLLIHSTYSYVSTLTYGNVCANYSHNFVYNRSFGEVAQSNKIKLLLIYSSVSHVSILTYGNVGI